jgi:glutaminyl-tRNA synthetase
MEVIIMSEKNSVSTSHEISNFLHRTVENDLKQGIFSRGISTRFPPEPNGYLHIGSAYAININYTIAKKFGGKFNLRFDDTNPLKENIEYVDSIIEDINWLGYSPKERIFYGSDYFETIYEYAVKLIKKDKAYVCDLSPTEIAEYRGTLTEPGKNSPYRNRTIEENLEIFQKMRDGKFPAASKVLRAKIDMSSPNINLRDPVIYRIIYAEHYRSGMNWCIYPMYDFAHPIQDEIEGITHSLCSMEFKDHRPLYEWFLNELEIKEPPLQREFGRLNLTGVVTSKRYLKQLVENGYVDGWSDPRLPTLRGLRRRGFTRESIQNFMGEIGVSKHQSTVDVSMLEHCLREDLKSKVNSVMAVLNPLKVVITNYPNNKIEKLMIDNNSENPELGKREVTFSKDIYIEKEDFMETPVKGFRRLSPNTEIRLKGAYFIKCTDVIKDRKTGEILELHCTYDPETKSGTGFSGRKVKGTIHWVSALDHIKADINLYNNLLSFDVDNSLSWEEKLNPNSLIKLKNCILESVLSDAKIGDRFQFIRHGYFCVDNKYTTKDKMVINRIVPLKDTWKKVKVD